MFGQKETKYYTPDPNDPFKDCDKYCAERKNLDFCHDQCVWETLQNVTEKTI